LTIFGITSRDREDIFSVIVHAGVLAQVPVEVWFTSQLGKVLLV